MEMVYVLLVIVLIGLSISALWVGVSKDAVNFLYSAIGSKSAPFWMITAVASLGLLVGAVFSGGMMEVARNGVFHAEKFNFFEIMVIFTAVMVTDVLFINTFNNLGLPTSTTVSLIFKLIGGTLAVSIISSKNASIGSILEYLNSNQTLVFISGIFISIALSFFLGIICQFLVRVLFSFNYSKTYKYFGALWGGLSITCSFYFLILACVKDKSLINSYLPAIMKINTWNIVAGLFVFSTLVLLSIQFLTKINILKIIVLVGTFSLAMAFAGNDMLNFIGVPLAGLKAVESWQLSGINPHALSMISLTDKFETSSFYLIIAGILMAIVLWLSKKARPVIANEINLSSYDQDPQKYEPSAFSIFILTQSIRISKVISFILPPNVLNGIKNRFVANDSGKENEPSIDLVRASVNLTISSILIALGTSMKLPLSTTYITLTVIMATAIADSAWRGESTIHPILEFTSIIAGWFFTVFIALSGSFLVALLIYYTNFIAVPILLIIPIVIIIKSNFHLKSNRIELNINKLKQKEKQPVDIFELCNINVVNSLMLAAKVFDNTIIAISSSDRKSLKIQQKEVQRLSKNTKSLKEGVETIIYELKEDSIDSGHYYVQVLDYLREISNSLTHITYPTYEHFKNRHSGFIPEKNQELFEINKEFQAMLKSIIKIISSKSFDNIEVPLKIQQIGLELTTKFRINEVKRIKNAQVGTKNSILFLNIIAEAKNILLFSGNLIKSHKDFIVFRKA